MWMVPPVARLRGGGRRRGCDKEAPMSGAVYGAGRRMGSGFSGGEGGGLASPWLRRARGFAFSFFPAPSLGAGCQLPWLLLPRCLPPPAPPRPPYPLRTPLRCGSSCVTGAGRQGGWLGEEGVGEAPVRRARRTPWCVPCTARVGGGGAPRRASSPATLAEIMPPPVIRPAALIHVSTSVALSAPRGRRVDINTPVLVRPRKSGP